MKSLEQHVVCRFMGVTPTKLAEEEVEEEEEEEEEEENEADFI